MYEFQEENNLEYKVADEARTYKLYKDFTSLECWKHARKVKLLFCEKVIPPLPITKHR